MSTKTKPSIVFAHGLWADGSCFSKRIPTLQAEGHDVIAAQNSLNTLEGDVAAVTRALGRVSSPAILVGHSYGGTVPHGRPELVVYVENAGDFTVAVSAVQAVHAQKVIVDCDKLDHRLRKAIGHAHDVEDPNI